MALGGQLRGAGFIYTVKGDKIRRLLLIWTERQRLEILLSLFNVGQIFYGATSLILCQNMMNYTYSNREKLCRNRISRKHWLLSIASVCVEAIPLQHKTTNFFCSLSILSMHHKIGDSCKNPPLLEQLDGEKIRKPEIDDFCV